MLGYNAILVATGAGLLGVAGGVTGTFLHLRKRALVSDAISHATLPGVALAFIAMVMLGGDGRNLFGLMAGSALSAGVGLLLVGWLTGRTRLNEDAAIGAVLSVLFGLGVVLLTVIQSMDSGRQAGLEGYLLGSTAGMLRLDAVIIAVGGAAVLALVAMLRRMLVVTAFDQGYATSVGIDPNKADLALMGLVLAVTVVGLKIVGLVLIVALLIVPPAAARFWTDRAGVMALISGAIGGVSGVAGAVVSASAPDLPTGPIIVLIGFALFLASLALAPGRGVVGRTAAHRGYRRRILRRQGLLRLAEGGTVDETRTRAILRDEGLIDETGVLTDTGHTAARAAAQDDRRWQLFQRQDSAGALARHDGLTPLDALLTRDEVAALDRQLAQGHRA